MEIERAVVLSAPPADVFPFVDDLGRYPDWMPLVHSVNPLGVDPSTSRPAWDVELRASVGPLARSKRLRMVRTVHDAPDTVVFERSENDGRTHAPWTLRATLVATGEGDTELTMNLHYGGRLWTGAVLQRTLDDHVERGAAALAAIVGNGDGAPER